MPETIMSTEDKNSGKFGFVGGALCLDFTNTASHYNVEPRNDTLQSYADLVEWGSMAGIIPPGDEQQLLREVERRPMQARAAFVKALALREVLHRIFEAVSFGRDPESADLGLLNRSLFDAMSHLRLVKSGDGFGWDWTSRRGNLEAIMWPVARSAAEVLTSEALSKVRQCGGDDCDWLFLDMTRNHSRQWCDMRDCGNRAKARRHYRKSVGKAPA